MAMNLYVGNLPWQCTADDLLTLFQEQGAVVRVQVISDKETGRSRGFGFVEMQSDSAGQNAIEKLDGTEYEGRLLTVKEARPREHRPDRGNSSRPSQGLRH
jgi:RNA recognition motif-containing protein